MTRVSVDHGRCEGHGQCAMMAFDVFELDDSGYARVVVDEIPEASKSAVEGAVFACPEGAIVIAE